MWCSLVAKQGTAPQIKEITQNTRFFSSFIDGCFFISSVKKKKKVGVIYLNKGSADEDDTVCSVIRVI